MNTTNYHNLLFKRKDAETQRLIFEHGILERHEKFSSKLLFMEQKLSKIARKFIPKNLIL